MDPVKVGVIGCGNISDVYFQSGKVFEAFEITACADLLPERASAKAAQHGVPKACSVDDLLADPDIGIVLNLTIPKAHAEVALRALEAGKSVYSEKPLAVAREEGERITALAKEQGFSWAVRRTRSWARASRRVASSSTMAGSASRSRRLRL